LPQNPIERRSEAGSTGPLALKSFSIFRIREAVIPIPPKCTAIITRQYTLNITPLEGFVKIKGTILLLKDSSFAPDMLPPFLMGKALGGYRRKAAVPVETAFPPVFNMAGAFYGRLGDPFPLRGIRIPVQQALVKTPDNPVFGYPDSLKGLAPGVPAYVVRFVRFDMVRLGEK
jgi:hypothetical protein